MNDLRWWLAMVVMPHGDPRYVSTSCHYVWPVDLTLTEPGEAALPTIIRTSVCPDMRVGVATPHERC